MAQPKTGPLEKWLRLRREPWLWIEMIELLRCIILLCSIVNRPQECGLVLDLVATIVIVPAGRK